ncbi:hypothetical protein PUN28_020790 [Cardiocondyla obscurior]|uniref:Uncharacterized protein n=1 Tax=Cardiocondyla obscurior TaxID=286306 RepID=A0AAW2E764_9HYME
MKLDFKSSATTEIGGRRKESDPVNTQDEAEHSSQGSVAYSALLKIRQLLKMQSQPDVKNRNKENIHSYLSEALKENCLGQINNEKYTIENVLHYENSNNLVIDNMGVDT